MIHKLEREMSRLIRRFMGYLVPARSIVDTPLRKVDYGKANQLDDEDLFIASEAKEFIKNADLRPATERRIFQ